MEDTQVLIVGAGPTGLSLACELARAGINFRIIDSRDALSSESKALAVQARTLELWERLGITERAIEAGHPAMGVDLTVRGQTIRAFELRNIGRGESPYPFVLILPQSKTERLLHDYLRSIGHEVEWRTEFVSHNQGESTTMSVCEVEKAGQPGTGMIRCRYLVGCDGASSTVRHTMSVPFRGGTYEREFYLGDVAMEGALDHERIHLVLERRRFVAVFPMPGERRFRVLGYVPRDMEGRDISFQDIKAIVENDATIPLTLTECRWSSRFRLHHRMVSTFRTGNVFLCGDAAHIHSPAGGQGMNTGIQDAINLAWKLAKVVRGYAGDRLLDSYGEERIPFARLLLRTTDRAFRLMTGRGRILSFMRLRVLPIAAPLLSRSVTFRRFAFRTASQIRIHYRGSQLSSVGRAGRAATLKPGERLPPITVIDSNRRRQKVYALLHPMHFTIFVVDDAESITRSFHDFPGPVHVVRIENQLPDGLAWPSGICIARPDGHVLFFGRPSQIADAREALARAKALQF